MYVPSQLVPFTCTNPGTFSSPSTAALLMSPVKHIHTHAPWRVVLLFSHALP